MSRNHPATAVVQNVECTLTETTADERRETVRSELAPAFREAIEHEDGYTLRFDGTPETLETLAWFVGSEAGCCSFADFSLHYRAPYETVELVFTGPEGTRALAREGLVEELTDWTGTE